MPDRLKVDYRIDHCRLHVAIGAPLDAIAATLRANKSSLPNASKEYRLLPPVYFGLPCLNIFLRVVANIDAMARRVGPLVMKVPNILYCRHADYSRFGSDYLAS